MNNISQCNNASHDLDSIIMHRAEKRVPAWDISRIIGFESDFYVAGSCLNAEHPNDIDVYPAESTSLSSILTDEIKKAYPVLSVTKNAITFNIKGKIVQICSYHKPSLEALVDSFDFAHCQVGVKFEGKYYDEEYGESGGYPPPEVTEVYASEDWKTAKMIQCTYFTGSEYPLSSLIRIVKYAKRDLFNGRSYIIDILNIMNNILERGYKDYADFKDQLDAVDLNLLGNEKEEDHNKVCAAAWKLWCNMSRRNLVEKVDASTEPDPEADE